MNEEFFATRLAFLRTQKGVSARDMSLSIGQNPGYINNIENGKALPSMSSFFFICDYLKISPQEFFDSESSYPAQYNSILHKLKNISSSQLIIIDSLLDELTH